MLGEENQNALDNMMLNDDGLEHLHSDDEVNDELDDNSKASLDEKYKSAPNITSKRRENQHHHRNPELFEENPALD